MSGGSKTTSTTTGSNTIDPALMALYQQNYASAQGVANRPYQPWTGQSVAPLTSDQTGAGNLFRGIAANQTGSATTGAGITGAGGVLGFDPATVNAGLLRNTDLTPYMNPFTSSVIDRTISDQERARQMAQVTQNQAASAAGAFGGSRSGVLGAETNAAYDRNTANLIAGLNSDNFAQAQAAATGDINRTLGADTTNVANSLASNQQRLGASGLLGDLGQQQLTMAQQQAAGQNAAGLQEQTTKQAEDDAIYQEFLRQVGYPIEQQNIRNASLGLIPLQQTTNSTTTQKQSGGGLGGILGAIGSIAGAIPWSDKRLKENIETVGKDDKGRRWVEYNYIWDKDTKHVGLLAQDVKKTDPKAVVKDKSGFYKVNYGLLGAA